MPMPVTPTGILTEVRLVQPSKIPLPNELGFAPLNTAFFKLVQSANARFLIETTLLGISISSNELQEQNAFAIIVVTLSGILTSSNKVQ